MEYGISEHFQNTQSFEDDKVLYSRTCTLGIITQGAFRATNFTPTSCCHCGFFFFGEKQTYPGRPAFTLCQHTRLSRSHFGIRTMAYEGERVSSPQLRHSSKTIKLLHAGHYWEFHTDTTTGVDSLWRGSGPGLHAVLGQNIIMRVKNINIGQSSC